MTPDRSVALYAKAADGQYYPAGLSTPVSATGTLTLAANPTAGETFTIGGIVYTWVTTAGSTRNQVVLGATASLSLDAAIAVLNRSTTGDTAYTNYDKAKVSAAAGSGDTMDVTALVQGVDGNLIDTTDGMANAGNVWGATTLTGGANGTISVTAGLPSGAATSAKQDTQITAEQAILATAGATNGAAVITDANGTLQQYLRGIVKLLITSGTIILGAGANAIGKLAANTGIDIGSVGIRGATNIASAQVTATGSAATLAIARSTRRSVLFTNTHASASVRIGPATVSAGNGLILGPGQSASFTWVGLFQVIDDGVTHPVVCVSDEYD